ncbi:hypothetical protein GA0061102_105427 [Rhizobium miluonense]|uniref:Uncharacterized protein n=1 Tax=Rhizobium miluonense TaxID=411945 RepID=A0A1C3X380_9HYPH|nr:hypothetical protein GA0061102_105427 [Rhizobium miluonense]
MGEPRATERYLTGCLCGGRAPITTRPTPRAIDIVCANTPQAKRRVERADQTLRDRLVKESRSRSIDTIAAANAHATEFISDFNAHFGKEPRNFSTTLERRALI